MTELPPLQLDFSEYQPKPSPTFGVDLPSASCFPAQRAEEVKLWVSELTAIVDAQVKEMLIKDHMLVPDLETLPMHVARTSAELFTVCRTYVRLHRLLWENERALKRIERDVKRQRDKAAALAAIRIRESHDALTIAQMKELLDSDEILEQDLQRIEQELIKAEVSHADIMEHEKGTYAMVEALRVKAGLLSGLQGAANSAAKMRA